MSVTMKDRALERVLDEVRSLSTHDAAEVLKEALETVTEAGKIYDRALGYY